MKTSPKNIRQPVQARGREKKERIISAARSLINDYGLEAVTTNRIAKEAGVSVGTLYSYFEDKHHIFEAVAEEYHADLFAWAAKEVDKLSEKVGGLDEAVSGLVGIIQQIHAREPGIHKEAVIQALRDPTAKSHSPDLDKSFDQAAHDLLKRFEDEIEMDDPEAGDYLIGVVAEETIHHLLIYGSPVPEDRVFAQLSRMLTRYLSKAF